MPFDCTIEEFKQRTAEFLKAAPTCDADSLDNGWKALGLSYLNLIESSPADMVIAASYLKFASVRYINRDFELSRLTA